MAEAKNIRPELPPHLRSPEETERTRASAAENRDDPSPIVGPILPPDFRRDLNKSLSKGTSDRKKNDDDGENDRKKDKQKKQSSPDIIGPVLPPHLRHLVAGPSREESGSDDGGSSSSSESDSDPEVIGPRVNLQGGDYDARKEFEERQRRAEEKKLQEPTRESWMTELPKDRTGVRISGTEARTFLKRGGEDTTLDDGWTDTPGQAKRPSASNTNRAEEEQLAKAQRKRDVDIDASLADYNAAKRSKALIDMHQEAKPVKKKKADKRKERKKDRKKREKDKKEKKKEKRVKSSRRRKDDDQKEAASTRKPFNWEEDMKVSMVDTSRAKAMLDRTLLQSRFAAGKTQKYL